jgi:hypothetical protein
MRIKVLLAVMTAVVTMMIDACGKTVSVSSIQLLLSSRIGRGVDVTTGASVCPVTSKDECGAGLRSDEPGGFHYLAGVAVDNDPHSRHYGDVYVADKDNQRIQELTSTGAFVSMFGWDVNGTKDREPAASQVEKNVCTEQEVSELSVRCRSGVMGTSAEQFTYPTSVTVDSNNGDVYVQEIAFGNYRVDKYTAEGSFIWMVGKGVNGTTKGNICTEQEIKDTGVKCRGGAESPTGNTEHGAFKFAQTYGDLLAAGGPEDLLYVGDEHRVQEFEPNGKWKRDISLTSISAVPYSDVPALAVDKTGRVYLVYREMTLKSGVPVEHSNIVREFKPDGKQILAFTVRIKQPNAKVRINGLAIDSSGRVAVTGAGSYITSPTLFGSLYDGNTGRHLAEFNVPIGNDGIAFNDNDDLYIGATDGEEVLLYTPAGRGPSG